MDERLQFVRDAASDRFRMSELCARYGVSRRIGYKWIARYDAEGRACLAAPSPRAGSLPHGADGVRHREPIGPLVDTDFVDALLSGVDGARRSAEQMRRLARSSRGGIRRAPSDCSCSRASIRSGRPTTTGH